MLIDDDDADVQTSKDGLGGCQGGRQRIALATRGLRRQIHGAAGSSRHRYLRPRMRDHLMPGQPTVDPKPRVLFSMTTAPPACLTFQAPAEPSEPVPVRLTAISRSLNALAAVERNRSIDGAIAPASAGRRRRVSPATSTNRFDGATKMTPSSRSAPVLGHPDREQGVKAEDLGQVARSVRIEMLRDDDRRRKVGGQLGDDPRERLDPAGRRADRDELRSTVRGDPRRHATHHRCGASRIRFVPERYSSLPAANLAMSSGYPGRPRS